MMLSEPPAGILRDVLLIPNPEFADTDAVPASVAPPMFAIVNVFCADVFAATDPKDNTLVEKEMNG